MTPAELLAAGLAFWVETGKGRYLYVMGPRNA